jgi:hypothetical protein
LCGAGEIGAEDARAMMMETPESSSASSFLSVFAPCHVVSDRPFAGSLEAHPKLPPVLTGALAVLRGAVGVL